MRRLGTVLTFLALLLASAAQAYADTQDASQPVASPDRNLWLGVVVLVLLIGSLIVVRPRPRR